MSFLLYPQLKNCRCLFLRNHSIMTNIGVCDFEKKLKQRLLINIDVYIPLSISTPKQDLLEEVVDYNFIRNVVIQSTAQGHIQLQETLCDDIITKILVNPKVLAARISTEKPDIYLDCESIGVEVFRIKNTL